ncbi:transcriptional regulator [Tamlana nanhaiensis]|uniref:Transcriptional regulator n=1 Tax=Neotamlana nanhaiensis TaxID=1382798 RepID=A0A0D7W5F0_9FLAO|nr:transcriptional regulator [Tamlana nanhaiensis]KJD33928.1 transcriptional regulator [Tamlana nanhaiensis]
MTEELQKQKCKLVEKLGVLFENKEQLAPVAARILSYVVLTGKVGVTFEDLVSNLCASKSTISTHLSHLQDLKKIEYFTKPGDRKKYFVVNGDMIIQSIDENIATWESQKQLHLEIKDYKEKMNDTMGGDEELQFHLDFHDNYLVYLNEAISALAKLKDKIIELENKQ